MVYNSNPVAVAPESGKVVRGFAREDLFTVVLEHFHTDTADYADYLLPATTQLEHWDVHLAYGHTDVLLNRPAIAPLGESRPNTQIFRELAARMGFDDTLLADKTTKRCAAMVRRPSGLQRAAGAGLRHPGAARRTVCRRRLSHALRASASFSATAAGARQGLDGLPDHLPNYEAAGSDPRHPLAMISPPARNFLNSSFVNVKSLRDIEGEPVLEICEVDASPRGITSGAVVRVFNDRGEYRVRATVSQRARPGVVNGLGIWWRKLGLDGTNVNQLTSQKLTDLGRGPVFYDCLVEVALA